MEQKHPKMTQLRKLSVLMDSQFAGPFGLKFGLDALLGLIPFIGDFIATGISLYIIFQSAKLGCAPSTLVRMGLNILLENVIGLFPFLGNVFDFFWKANNKNIEILEHHFANPRAVTIKSRLTLGLIAFILLGVIILSLALTFYVLKSVIEWIALFTS